jgi:hypothetical protein
VRLLRALPAMLLFAGVVALTIIALYAAIVAGARSWAVLAAVLLLLMFELAMPALSRKETK